MKRIALGTGALLVGFALAFASCDSAGTDLADTGALALRQERVDVCHYDSDSGTFHRLTVAAAALPAHLAHGDAVPGDPVPGQAGFSFDEACDAVADAPPALPNMVTVLEPSPAAGVYEASLATFGPPATVLGVTAPLSLVNGPAVGALPGEGCGPLIGFPAGAIAVIYRGSCFFVEKALNAQNAGASAVILVNNMPGLPPSMGGDDPGLAITSVMVSQDDGNLIIAGLPATATVSAKP